MQALSLLLSLFILLSGCPAPAAQAAPAAQQSAPQAGQSPYKTEDLHRWLGECMKVYTGAHTAARRYAEFAALFKKGNIFALLGLEAFAKTLNRNEDAKQWAKLSEAKQLVTLLREQAVSGPGKTDARAHALLGDVYQHGLAGKEENPQLALGNYGAAAELGNAYAQLALGAVFFEDEDIRDEAQGASYLQMAADQGLAEAQSMLGERYASGHGVAKNERAAVELYLKAAEQGHAGAQYNLAFMYLRGYGVARDDLTAAEWLKKSAAQGYAVAQYRLGILYANGNGVVKDERKAFEWLKKSAEQGYAVAQYRLGIMYANGNGVPKDKSKAAAWHTKAAQQGHKKAAEALENLK